MTADKIKPPTEAELAAIRKRAAKVKPRRWYATLVVDEYMLLATQQYASRNMLNKGECMDAKHNARLASHAPADVPALLAAIEERDHLIWVMSQDQEAYRRGVEDGARRQRSDDLAWMKTNASTPNPALLQILESLPAWTDREPPPLPPDRARAECERLRAALRAIAMLEPDDDSPAGVGMTLLVAQRIAREALGEDS